MAVLGSKKRQVLTRSRRRKWPARLIAVLALAVPVALLVAGCGSGPVSTIDEGIAVTVQPITTSSIISRAMQWVHARLTYCQVPNGSVDAIDPACSYICHRKHNKHWDPYRSDCSGLVSWAWNLPPPGLVTWNFAPFNQGAHVSYVVKAIDLRPGDALNSYGHIILFKRWVHKGSRADLIEEPGCSVRPDYAHEFTATVYIHHSNNTITIPGYGDIFHPIRYKGALVEKTDKARAVRKWSNAKRFHGKAADYLVCAGQKFKFTFTFRNTGTAVWRDVKGRGSSVGSDVFLVTTSGKKDRLTGHQHYSVRSNKNSHVRGDRNAPNCNTHNGCRQTTFIHGGMTGHAPNKPGIYKSRWRLRDFSKHWGNHSHGFGPKVQLKLKVVNCKMPPGGCGCRVWCSNGASHQLSSSIQTQAACTNAARQYCRASQGNSSLFVTKFNACPVPLSGSAGASNSGAGGASSNGGAAGASSNGGAAGASSNGGAGGASSNGGASSSAGLGGQSNGIAMQQSGDNSLVQDDPGYSDYGFTGGGSSKAASCSVAAVGHERGAPLGLGALMLLFSVAELRRRQRRTSEAKL